MITLDKISYEIGGRFLFQNASLQISKGDRIGLIGKNGTGKTTLLKLIVGEDSPSEGIISSFKNLKIGYLPQEHLSFHSDKTALDTAMEAFDEQIQLQQDIEEILKKLETDYSEPVIQALTDKQIRLENLGGADMEARAHAVLDGLGFSTENREATMETLSGGWRMRVMLGKLLLAKPDILLMDEPTNHLDLPSIEWLEGYLGRFEGALIIVSHDLIFLDRLVNKTVEISRSKFNIYKGNYSFYLKEREVRLEIQQREYENQQKFIKDAERFIERFRAKASKAKQAQSKIKMLEKLEIIEPPDDPDPEVSFHFKPAVQPGKDVLNLKIKQKKYGDKVVLGPSHLQMMRGDKIALVGANGKGKSTALRIIGGEEPFNGELKIGHNVELSFFAQHQLDALNIKNTILGELEKWVMTRGETFVRSVLGGFLFSGDDVKKKIMVLSGGEKSRVALAKTLLLDANFLLLDEPTNHLDISSINVLVKALEQYEGTFIVVSHDRYFLSRVANKVWYIDDQELKEYPGDFNEFQESTKGQKALSETLADKVKEEKKAPKEKSSYREDKENKKKRRRLQSAVERTENEIQQLESKKEQILTEMSDPELAREFEKLQVLQDQIDKVEQKLSASTVKWEEALMELEEMDE